MRESGPLGFRVGRDQQLAADFDTELEMERRIQQPASASSRSAALKLDQKLLDLLNAEARCSPGYGRTR